MGDFLKNVEEGKGHRFLLLEEKQTNR